MRFISVVFTAVLLLTISMGCRTIDEIGATVKFPSGGKTKVKHKGHGPPPHAPAHGYRQKNQHGLELEFDSGLGVYLTVEMPGVYFQNDLYIRLSDGQWTVATHFDGPWRVSVSGEIPLKLESAKGKGHKSKGHKGKGKGFGKNKKGKRT